MKLLGWLMLIGQVLHWTQHCWDEQIRAPQLLHQGEVLVQMRTAERGGLNSAGGEPQPKVTTKVLNRREKSKISLVSTREESLNTCYKFTSVLAFDYNMWLQKSWDGHRWYKLHQDCMPRVMTLPEEGEFEAWKVTVVVKRGQTWPPICMRWSGWMSTYVNLFLFFQMAQSPNQPSLYWEDQFSSCAECWGHQMRRHQMPSDRVKPGEPWIWGNGEASGLPISRGMCAAPEST